MSLDLDLNQLRTFFVLVQSGHFCEAARRMHRTQSAISHAIRKLEESAGVLLVDRRVKSLRLTDEGRRLYRTCESVFASIEAVREDFRRSRSLSIGRIRVGSTVEFGCHVLINQIGKLLGDSNEIEIDFYFGVDLLNPLLRDEIDIAIDCVEHFSPELQKVPLFKERYIVVCTPKFQHHHNIHVPEDLFRCPVISLDKSGEWWERFLMNFPFDSRPKFQRLIALNHIRGMVHAALQGLGAVLVPQYSAQIEINRGELVELFPSIDISDSQLYKYYFYQKITKARHLKHRLLLDFLQSLDLSDLGCYKI